MISPTRIAREARTRRHDPDGLREWLREMGVEAPFDLPLGRTPRELERIARAEARRLLEGKQHCGEIELRSAWSLAMAEMHAHGYVSEDLIERIARASGAPPVIVIDSNESTSTSCTRVERSRVAELVRAVRNFTTRTWMIDANGITCVWLNRALHPGRVRLGKRNGARYVGGERQIILWLNDPYAHVEAAE